VAGDRPSICGAPADSDIDAVHSIESYADLFEVRIDLIGDKWPELVPHIHKPWIATNRLAAEGGRCMGSEDARIAELLRAVDLGASIIDIELAAPGLKDVMKVTEGRVERIISYHNFNETLPPEQLEAIISRQQESGADICKVVTTANTMQDNITVLTLVRETVGIKIVSFAMGEIGQVSRVLSPLAGAYFTFASMGQGKESAPGQITAEELREIYRCLEGGF